MIFINNELLSEKPKGYTEENLLSLDSKIILEKLNYLEFLNNRDQLSINQCIDLINKLNFKVKSNKDMSIVLKKIYDKDYKYFINNLLGIDLLEYSCSINLINTTMFVVKDLDNFIQSVANSGFEVNKGSKKCRGEVNSMNNLLSLVDIDYRDSLYNHSNYHLKDKRIYSNLTKDKFSFKNIHMNIGKIR